MQRGMKGRGRFFADRRSEKPLQLIHRRVMLGLMVMILLNVTSMMLRMLILRHNRVSAFR